MTCGCAKNVCKCVSLCIFLSHSGTPVTVGAVVKVHSQPGCLDVSVDLHLPVMDEGGGTDDESAV